MHYQQLDQSEAANAARPDGTDFVPNDEIGPMDAGYTEVLPPVYSDLSQTELTAAVPEGGGELEFKLLSKKP